jgi:hypothetical protein
VQRLALLLLAAALAAGCAYGDDEPAYGARDLPRLVLGEGDLGGDWVVFDTGRQTHLEAGPEPARYGREAGWKARLRRPDARVGPLVVESRADLFADADGARRELGAAREEAADREEPLEGLGDDAFVYRTDEGDVDYVRVAWRRDNVVARVVVSGFDVELGDARAIAERQDEKLSRAARA